MADDKAAKSPVQKAVERIVEMESQTDPIYLLGRLFAVTQHIVYAADGERAADDLAADTMERLPLMPTRYYVKLARLATTRLSRIKTPGWRHAVYDKLLTRVAAETGLDLPKRLSDEQFDVMSMGYHHQRAALFATGVMETREEYDEAMEAAKAGVATLVAGGMSEVEAAERVGLNRMTVRKALGK